MGVSFIVDAEEVAEVKASFPRYFCTMSNGCRIGFIRCRDTKG
jgi:hypothetical protein